MRTLQLADELLSRGGLPGGHRARFCFGSSVQLLPHIFTYTDCSSDASSGVLTMRVPQLFGGRVGSGFRASSLGLRV